MSREEAVDAEERQMLRQALRSTGYAAAGAGIGILALYTIPFLLLVAVLCLVGVGWPLAKPMTRWIRALADLERRRLRRLGHEIEAPYPRDELEPDRSLRALFDTPHLRRDLGWLFLHATWGLILGAVVLQLPINAVRDVTYPLWWLLAPEPDRDILSGVIPADSWNLAPLGVATGIAMAALWVFFAGKLLEYQNRPGVNLLGPDPDVDLSQRVAQLTATRAAALDAHAVELRRIERALHDGAQNRMVGVAVLVGAARREVDRNPERADEILARAQDSVEDALAELRAVVRSILPPVLEDRGLEGALSALASDCPVPCSVTVDVPIRCPASTEATAYFVVAESLTNVAKHSRAEHAEVEVRLSAGRLHVTVTDDGRGGADAGLGSGLAGIDRRVEAHDGDVTVTSPPGGPTEIRVELPCGS
ncbi:sensor histidine kinase [Glycomyces sp. L485]|uniref:sensor histidine kinase n=1 Tax=Glycomyces sp. L485 TaxID=2909235 RepID=UPI001F4BAFC4|nr:sensor histidine kinase [Glycomyces sp. L485]MCH7232800.1 sensor histidine kinase [Glycomyces sp. L485]